eukprot:gene38578-47642_t
MTEPCEVSRRSLLSLVVQVNSLLKSKESEASRLIKAVLKARDVFAMDVDSLTFTEKRMDAESRELLLKWSSQGSTTEDTGGMARRLIAEHLHFSHPTIRQFICFQFVFISRVDGFMLSSHFTGPRWS